MKTISGDLISLAKADHFDVIVHGCNCFCTMGAGIAKAIRAEFPEAYEADKQTAKGDRDKLGTYSSATITVNGRQLTIVNAYTQFDYRGRGVKADYDAVAACFAAISRDFADQRIGLPKIGAGLAGGDWNHIAEIIDRECSNIDITMVEFASSLSQSGASVRGECSGPG